ncbi:hypothetical protein PABG_03452 [Paracoccidioides brasiliensis Pb03]|nr:hypothetical protein PABG_03452 [Paracoccidioides brasiliensis Pb03]
MPYASRCNIGNGRFGALKRWRLIKDGGRVYCFTENASIFYACWNVLEESTGEAIGASSMLLATTAISGARGPPARLHQCACTDGNSQDRDILSARWWICSRNAFIVGSTGAASGLEGVRL